MTKLGAEDRHNESKVRLTEIKTIIKALLGLPLTAVQIKPDDNFYASRQGTKE